MDLFQIERSCRKIRQLAISLLKREVVMMLTPIEFFSKEFKEQCIRELVSQTKLEWSRRKDNFSNFDWPRPPLYQLADKRGYLGFYTFS